MDKEIHHWIEPDVKIGYSNDYDKNSLVIAEIKSVRKQVNGSYYAGLEITGTHCAAIKVSGADSDIDAEAQAGYLCKITP